jgi:glycosyltransferase involved in cell wall biosynthesis
MVAMPSLHFFRWTEQLRDSGHEVFWFDITDGGEIVSRIHWVEQIVNWKLKYDYPGRYFLKENFRKTYDFFQQFNEKEVATVFEQKLLEIQPDVVHSFALHIACVPIAEVMNKHKNIKWAYSSWGSDLYARKEKDKGLFIIKQTLPLLGYLFTDCKRDFEIAKQYGFPGGGGYDLGLMKSYSIPFDKRKIILIKGYQGVHGKCIEVLKVLTTIKKELSEYQIVVFGTDAEVVNHVRKEALYNGLNLLIKEKIPHQEVLKLMGNAKIYLGYSNSDGIPNTLLEAIYYGCLPLQSNPGGATSEIIKDNFNGFLLDLETIKNQILQALNTQNFSDGLKYNNEVIVPQLSFNFVRKKVLEAYNKTVTLG